MAGGKGGGFVFEDIGKEVFALSGSVFWRS